jgi:hypothetical protein
MGLVRRQIIDETFLSRKHGLFGEHRQGRGRRAASPPSGLLIVGRLAPFASFCQPIIRACNFKQVALGFRVFHLAG